VHSNQLLFVPNTGQFDPRVRFQLRGSGGVWWFTDDALWLTVLEKPAGARDAQALAPHGRGADIVSPRRGVHLKLTFPGISPAARLIATDPQPAKMNYFLGSDAAQWRAHVPTYGTLRWEGVYPGVNLVFGRAGAGRGLTVEADNDAAPTALRVRIEGAEAVRADAAGWLIADTPVSPIALPPLLTRDGTPLRPTVVGDSVTFAPHPFNPFPESVDSPPRPADDPSDLLYSTYLGGSDWDNTYDIALGSDGSVYVTGWTWSSDFPTTPGAFDPTCNTCPTADAFVTRLNAGGSALVYSTFLGGRNTEIGYGIAVGADGSAYVTGYTFSSDFPITPGAFQTSCAGSCRLNDAFVTRLTADGTALVYSTFLGGGNFDDGYDIALGADGSAYVTGATYSSDFPITPDAYDPTCGTDGRCNPYLSVPQSDAFVTRLNADGSGLVYSTFLGGSSYDCAGTCYIALGGDGSTYLTGNTCSSDFPTTPGAYDTSFNGASGDCLTSTQGDGYVAKLSADGSVLIFSTYLGGSDDDVSYDIALGADGSAYVTGYTYSTDFPTTPGAYDTVCEITIYGYCLDAFVTKVSGDGSVLLYSTFLGGNLGTVGYAIAVSADGAAYVTGSTVSTDFPTTSGAYDTTCGTDGLCNYDGTRYYPDVILTKLSAGGSALVYGTFLGGSGDDEGLSLALGRDGSVYITGVTLSTDFPTTPGAFDLTCGCDPLNFIGDAFLTRLSPDLVRMHVASITPRSQPVGSRYRLTTRITIQDSAGAAVTGAAVGIEVTRPDGRTLPVTKTTNSRGQATIAFLTSLTGTYTFCVTSVVKYGWLYDPSQNAETCDSITIP